jgi:hypothetical protein
MMLVGTSLGGCLKSIATGEVSTDDVLVIITRTDCRTIEELIGVVKTYYEYGNAGARQRSNYDLSECDLDRVIEIASELYHNGKIHQPRLYNGFGGFVHIELSRKEIWIPLAPSPKTDDERVVEAYEKYTVLRNLLK